jgi:hypothetical protein
MADHDRPEADRVEILTDLRMVQREDGLKLIDTTALSPEGRQERPFQIQPRSVTRKRRRRNNAAA